MCKKKFNKYFLSLASGLALMFSYNSSTVNAIQGFLDIFMETVNPETGEYNQSFLTTIENIMSGLSFLSIIGLIIVIITCIVIMINVFKKEDNHHTDTLDKSGETKGLEIEEKTKEEEKVDENTEEVEESKIEVEESKVEESKEN